jgi:hypothetical protein
MKIWVPKSGKDYSPESIEAIWEAWRNDAPKDEWAGTELGLLRAYWFPGHVTASDGSVGTGSMGAGFVWLDRSKYVGASASVGASALDERRKVQAR